MNREFNSNAILTSTLNIVRGKKSPMDLVEITMKNSDRTIYSFLSIGWGLLADIDIESEHLRIMGGLRFTIWSIVRICCECHVLKDLISTKTRHTLNSPEKVSRETQLSTSQRIPETESF